MIRISWSSFSNSFSSWRRFINFLLLQFCHKAFMNDFILAVAAVSHWKIRMKLSLGGSWKSGRISFMALSHIFWWKPSCKMTTTFKQRNLCLLPHFRYFVAPIRNYVNYVLVFIPIIVIIDFGNSVQAISIPNNLLNYTHFWLTFITHNITIYTPRISWSLILCCCKNPLISRVTKVLNDAAPESHWKNQKFPTAEKYCPIRNVPPSNWTTLGRRTPSAKVQHSVVVAQHRDNCFSMRPLHYCCRCTV